MNAQTIIPTVYPQSTKAVFEAKDCTQSGMHFAAKYNNSKNCIWSHVEKNRSCK